MSKEFLLAYRNLLNSINAIKKDSDNPYYKSKYADLNAIFDEVKEKLDENGFILLQNVENNTLRTQIIHIETGEKLESIFDLVTKAPDMQQIGSAVTYARRYSLLPMLNIETEDDDGNKACGKEPTSFEEFVRIIYNETSIKALNALYYKWKEVYPEDTEEFKSLAKFSSNMKLKLSNPETNVDIFSNVSNRIKNILGENQ